MQKYNGQIKTCAQARTLAKSLRENNGGNIAVSAATWIEQCPERFLARPYMHPELIALANTTPMSRKGSITDRIING